MKYFELRKLMNFILSKECRETNFWYEYENKNLRFQKNKNFITIFYNKNSCLFIKEENAIYFNFNNNKRFNELIAKSFNRKIKNIEYYLRIDNTTCVIKTECYGKLYFDEDLYNTIIGDLFNE